MRHLGSAIVLLFATLANAAPLDQTLTAHGGLDRWRDFGTLRYTLDLQFGPRVLDDKQTFDLASRDGLIVSDDYRIGSVDGAVWSTPDPQVLLDARFYLWTPFYFFNIPFVFADGGVTQTALEPQSFDGRTFDATKITFAAGTGDAPDDYYIVYADPQTHRVQLVRYIVTYGRGATTQPSESVMVIDEWQQVQGLTVPKTATFYHWNDGKPLAEPKGKMSFSDVSFQAERPQSQTFAKPDGAVDVPLPGR